MRSSSILDLLLRALLPLSTPHLVSSSSSSTTISNGQNISAALFHDLEELARIVDIAYCVGTTGIFKPFLCASRCSDFPTLELVDTFNTGPLMSDSCGYVALDHGVTRVRDDGGVYGPENAGAPTEEMASEAAHGRILVVFRGTYSIANTIVDLSTVPQEYVPYPENPDEVGDPNPPSAGDSAQSRKNSFFNWLPSWRGHRHTWFSTQTPFTTKRTSHPQSSQRTCTNCTVHSGFWTSWRNTRRLINPHLEALRTAYPDYTLHLVGHSLGGAVALLAALECEGRGWKPVVTTFGEPRVGNTGLRDWVDWKFALPTGDIGREGGRYRRVTHVDDPVPLLPLREWGYRSHAGEVYIAKPALQPAVTDLRLCDGDADESCIARGEVDVQAWRTLRSVLGSDGKALLDDLGDGHFDDSEGDGDRDGDGRVDGLHARAAREFETRARWGLPIPARFRMWQLFFAHRDYFWRLGLCVPGGDPWGWGREGYGSGGGDGGGGHGGEDKAERERESESESRAEQTEELR